MRTRVKMCGMTRLVDARWAVECGADAIGFVFYRHSPRCVPVAKAAEMIQALPPFISKVGVFVNPSYEQVARTIEQTHIDTLQFHGDESPAFCGRFAQKTIKAARMRSRASFEGLAAFPTDAWLVDGDAPGEFGGTGARFDWDLIARREAFDTPVILAGGLDAENVARAILTVRPYAVDVSSGVEERPGRKCADKIRRFMESVRSTSTSGSPRHSRT